LKFILDSWKTGKASQFGISFLPGFLLNDVDTSLLARGLDEYEKGHNRLHNIKEHMANMFELFESEPGFNKQLAFNNLLQQLHQTSFKEQMKGSDWRYFFIIYQQTLLPCIQHERSNAE
jgi:hypothetical protein